MKTSAASLQAPKESGSAAFNGEEQYDLELAGWVSTRTLESRNHSADLINILTKQMSLDTLIKRIREREIDLSPDFQRAEVWKPTARNRLIECFLSVFHCHSMWTRDEEHWLVVDGLPAAVNPPGTS